MAEEKKQVTHVWRNIEAEVNPNQYDSGSHTDTVAAHVSDISTCILNYIV